MKRFTLGIAALTALSGSLSAQSLVGTWQGTVQASQGGQLRVVLKVSTTPTAELTAVIYNIDQGAQPINANAVSLQGPAVKFSIVPIGIRYEGMLSPDGNSITGTWQGAASQQVTFARATQATAWAIPEPPPPQRPMAVDADPSFEVATIKPSPADARGTNLTIDRGSRMIVHNKSLAELMFFAYEIHPRQLRGLPDGLGSQRFEIEAKPDTLGKPDERQLKSMIRKLLAERFRLTTHLEQKEMSVFAITVAAPGPKLAKTQIKGTLFSQRGTNRTVFTNARVADLAGFLQGSVLDRPVVDQSGLDGRYDFTLDFRPGETQSAPQSFTATAADPNAENLADIFTAMRQQLGLKLEAIKAPVNILVIDHVEKPSEN